MKLIFKITFMMVYFKSSLALAPEYVNRWVVWNTGQGQWVTHILNEECLHYDMGGELGSFKKVKKSLLILCGLKKNKISLSHWDFDHILNIFEFSRAVPYLCWSEKPTFDEAKKNSQKILALRIPACLTASPVQIWKPTFAKTSNDSSFVYKDQHYLMPGDSTLFEENVWSEKMSHLDEVHVLILGHHGSRTSTGEKLLMHLKNLKLAIASARYAKYKHPHYLTVRRLHKFNIPLLKTEDWGNIFFN